MSLEIFETMAEAGFFITRFHKINGTWYCEMNTNLWWQKAIGVGNSAQEAVVEAYEKVAENTKKPNPFHVEHPVRTVDDILEGVW